MEGVHVRDQILAVAQLVDVVAVVHVPMGYPGHLGGGGLVHHAWEHDARWTGGLPVVRLVTRRVRLPGVSRALRVRAAVRLARAIVGPAGVDLVHGETSVVASELVAIGRALGAPTVLTDHWGDLVTGKVSRRAQRAIRRAMRRVDAVAASASTQRDALVEQRFARDIAVVPCVFDVDAFARVDRPGRAPGEPAHLVAVGTLATSKGQRDLVHAVARLRGEGVTVTLTLVGGGPGRARVDALIDELDLRDAVTVTGEASRAEVARHLAAADVYVLPSHSEMFSVATLEAAGSGLPVVATRCGGMGDYLPEDATVMVEPNDVPSLTAGVRVAVLELEARTVAARRAAPALRQRYSPTAVGRDLADLFGSVLAARPYTHAAADGPAAVVEEGD